MKIMEVIKELLENKVSRVEGFDEELDVEFKAYRTGTTVRVDFEHVFE